MCRRACRGLVACANANAPHTNSSQFFITLDRAEGLDKKNTIFGKVTGDTIYNLANMNDLEVDDKERWGLRLGAARGEDLAFRV